MTQTDASSEQAAVRLQVLFPTLRELVAEYTRVLAKGFCRIHSDKPPALGTKYAFELQADGHPSRLEVMGEVASCEPSLVAPKLHQVLVTYRPSGENEAVVHGMVEELLRAPRTEGGRRFERIPVNLVARDGRQMSQRYLMRDLSMGGFSLRASGHDAIPAGVRRGTEASLVVMLEDDDPLEIRGEVVWVSEHPVATSAPAVGVCFSYLDSPMQTALDHLTRLSRPKDVLITFA
jgi:Tfp pilus assembly protein PilZ